MKPIKPEEVVARKTEIIPDEVIDAANDLIALNWDGNKSTFTLKALKEKVKDKFLLNCKDVNLNTKWLDIEPIYREEGWKVSYDSPCYDENFDAYFEFKQK